MGFSSGADGERDLSGFRSGGYSSYQGGGGGAYGGQQSYRSGGGYNSSQYGGQQYFRGGDSYGFGGRDHYSGLCYRDASSDKITKNFYAENPEVASMGSDDVNATRQSMLIRVISDESSYNGEQTAPKPITDFRHVAENFPAKTSEKFTQFDKPSPIQCQSWPVALTGRDMIGIAQTGSGKTLSFLAPAFTHVQGNKSYQGSSYSNSPAVLVLAPTRELVQQIHDECRKFAPDNQRSTALVGGTPKGPQIGDLKRGCDIVIATPGRLIDLLNMKIFTLDRVSYFCLDEADRMLDMGFEPDMRDISGRIRRDRQTLFFSATWPRQVERLAKEMLTGSSSPGSECKPVHIHIGGGEVGELKANPSITQKIELIQGSDMMSQMQGKKKKLCEILQQENMGGGDGDCDWSKKIIIFVKTKRGCDDLAYALQMHLGYKAQSIHGDKSQQERDWALAEFRRPKNSSCNILVATDVAARGLDIQGVECVINFDFPSQIEDYVHRIGRCGRAGKTGTAYSFFCASTDVKDVGGFAQSLIKILDASGQEVPDELRSLASTFYYGGGKGGRFGGGGGGGKGKGKGAGKYGGGGGGGYGNHGNHHSASGGYAPRYGQSAPGYPSY